MKSKLNNVLITDLLFSSRAPSLLKCALACMRTHIWCSGALVGTHTYILRNLRITRVLSTFVCVKMHTEIFSAWTRMRTHEHTCTGTGRHNHKFIAPCARACVTNCVTEQLSWLTVESFYLSCSISFQWMASLSGCAESYTLQ